MSFPQTVFPGKNAFNHPKPAPEPARIGPFTKGQWAGAVIVGGIALLGAAAMAVLFVRWLLSLEPLQNFLTTYPGEYHLPDGAPVGFPGWLGWQHFLNVFLMVLIIRSGLRIRNEKRPTAFWTPRGNAKGKVSLTIWFHQSLDILWLINGVVFIVLLFVTGQWMRVIPTSWEVFPNAISAVLQYISLDWPTENGWVNYNSIQQLTYFLTIFIAAPLAAVTGFRMSGMWPRESRETQQGLSHRMGTHAALPGHALLRRIHRDPHLPRALHRSTAQPQPHVRRAGLGRSERLRRQLDRILVPRGIPRRHRRRLGRRPTPRARTDREAVRNGQQPLMGSAVVSPREVRVDSGGVELVGDHWSAATDAQGAVLLLHGGGQRRHSWRRTGQWLAEAGWSAWAFDARGHGESGRSPDGNYSVSALVDDVIAIIDQIGEAPVLVGASMGGMTSLIAEGERGPLARALVLVDIVARIEPEGSSKIQAFMRSAPNGFASLEEASDAIAAYNPHRPRPTSLDGLRKNLVQRDDGRWHWHWTHASWSAARSPSSRSATSAPVRRRSGSPFRRCLSAVGTPTSSATRGSKRCGSSSRTRSPSRWARPDT